jgi:alpha-galactosidase
VNIGELIKNAVSSIRFKDNKGIVYEVNSRQKNRFVDFCPNIIKSAEGMVELNLTVKNISDRTFFIDEVAAIDISSQNAGILKLDGNINSWTMFSAGLGAGVKDLCDPCHNENKLDYSSPYYSLIANRNSGKQVFLGFLSFDKQHTEIRLKAVEGFKFDSLKAVCGLYGLTLKPGEELHTETLYVNTVLDPASALKEYFNQLRPKVEAGKVIFKDIIGWSTWDYYQSGITEKDVLKNMEWLKQHKEIPVEYIQLDAGFSDCEGDWLVTNKKFPHGLKWLSDKIKEYGFRPALWLCPFLVAPMSKIYQEHPDWVIKTANGDPLEVTGYAVKTVYALDCSIPEVCDWIRELARTVTVDYGYEYIKLDGANGQGISRQGVLANPEVTISEAMRNGFKAFKDGMKKHTFLLNASLFGLSLGIADGMRIGEDTGARWDRSKIDKHRGERDGFDGPGEVIRAIAATMNHYQQHKKLWINDPDYLIVRQQGSNSELSYEEAKSWASIVSLSNGLVMLSDNMTELSPDRVELLEKVLPHYKQAAEPIDFFRKNIPSFYSLKVKNRTEKWDIIGITNVDYPARTREYSLDFKAIALPTDKEYHVFDFWASEYKGVLSNHYKVSLSPHCCQIVAIRENKNVPQVLSTDLHITQGGIELDSCEFINNTLKIKTTDRGRIGNIFIFVPDGFEPADGLKKHSKNVWKYKVKFEGQIIECGFNN